MKKKKIRLTQEENNDEDRNEPVGEHHAERDTDGDSEHEHGLEEQGEVVVDDRNLLRRMQYAEIVPHR